MGERMEILIYSGVGLIVLMTWLLGLKLLVGGVIPIKLWMVGVYAIIAIVFLFNLDAASNRCN
jgi:hypothetical protein